MTYLRNVWYVAGWADELTEGKLLARQFLDDPVVMFRGPDGLPKALIDRCAHRFAPLSMGKLCDGGAALQCGYHGLRFDGSGKCIHNPHGEGRIPSTAVVRAYPITERWSLLWIWMGDPALADPALIPEFSFMDPEHWFVGNDYLEIEANYVLESDNILDLSHIQYLHPSTLGSGIAGEGKTVVTQEGNTIWSRRFIQNETLPPFLYDAIGMTHGTPCDRWLDVRWDAPALMWLQADIGPSGQSRDSAIRTPGAHLFTPASQSRTHYFFSICFPKAMGPMGEQLAKQNVVGLRGPFVHEDKPMVEAQQRAIGDRSFWDMKPALLDVDGPAIRARRLLEKLIVDEQAVTSGVHKQPL
jgi:phenylpropionate dioxygenase-like ring-hydroxylating dioxygenase large terminal subunit